jgi:hypothetical protein
MRLRVARSGGGVLWSNKPSRTAITKALKTKPGREKLQRANQSVANPSTKPQPAQPSRDYESNNMEGFWKAE